MPLTCQFRNQQLPAQVCSESPGWLRARPWLTATSHRERLKFWLCCKPRQHSHRFSWGRDSPQLTNDAPGALGAAMFAHPQLAVPGGFPAASGQRCSLHRYQAPFPNHCPPGRPGTRPKGFAVLAMQCPTVSPVRTGRDQLPKSPAAPWTLPPLERKPKVHFLIQLL